MTPKTASSVTVLSGGGFSSFLSLILGDMVKFRGIVRYQDSLEKGSA